jgi:hypothetical protein
MHLTEDHEVIAGNPKLLATLTSNPRTQWGENATVLFVWRDCVCGSSIAVTVAQEAAAADIRRVGTGDAIVLAHGHERIR